MANILRALCAALAVSLMTGAALGCKEWEPITVADARAASNPFLGSTRERLAVDVVGVRDGAGERWVLHDTQFATWGDHVVITGTDTATDRCTRRFHFVAAPNQVIERPYWNFTGLYLAIAIVALAGIATLGVVIACNASDGCFPR